MDEYPDIRTGIDIVGRDYLAAQVEYSDSNVKVLALSKISSGELTRSLFSDNSRIVLAVSDSDIKTKHITAADDNASRREKIIRFELQNALLDDSREYCCDIIEGHVKNHLLASIVRKNSLEKLSQEISSNENGSIEPEGFVTRSVALGRGFIRFCSNDSQRLVALADFNHKSVSLVFVLGNNIAATACLDQSKFDIDSEFGFFKLSAELKTIVNFKLNELSQRGLASDLTRLIISSSILSQSQKEAIAAKLAVALEEPIFDRVLSDKPVIETNVPLADFLVPLGLTIE